MENLSITFVLDETGSMEPIKDDTIGGFNAYLDSLKKDREANGGEIEFTLLKFDSNRVEKVYVAQPIADVEPLTVKTYVPGAATPLIDACCKAIKATEDALEKRADKPKILFVIQTDGHENASTEFKNTDLTTMIKEKRAEGWEFVFIGAGIDAFDAAGEFGIAAASTMSYSRQNSVQAFHGLASNTAAYRVTGKSSSLSWTKEQRQSSGDEYHKPPADESTAQQAQKIAVDDISLDKH